MKKVDFYACGAQLRVLHVPEDVTGLPYDLGKRAWKDEKAGLHVVTAKQAFSSWPTERHYQGS